ncbi:MAG: SH3 domain-containing protein [Marinospirillum sp.]|uniref:SH3 domain-containing protein n=1 Tax=Marinospirillum sp. TaxID=2183934 RepID=UPI0019DEB43E|nr:SH3 domain-containing protein [Marinospirillum sp.]MBE0505657.1 SH3 domain-containing protein [Marinospirillum sp.]
MNGISGNKLRPQLLSRQLYLLIFIALSLMIPQAVAAPGESWVISVPVGNVRDRPAQDGALVAQLPAGTPVTEIERSGAWLRVRLPDGVEAWMHQVTLSQTVDLFGLSLQTVDRKTLRPAIRAAGVEIVREVDSYPYDLYDPSDWMAGSTEMAVGYTLDQQLFAVAEITFRSLDDTDQVRKIADQVSQQLGPWQRVLGRRAEGPVEFEWQRGGVKVMVHRGWPDTTTYLTYEIPERLEQMHSAQQAQ